MARKSLTPKQSLFVGITLFSMFFGAGNLILPPLLGLQAGASAVPAMAGFLVTGIGLPMLGIIAVGLASTIRELASRVHPVFAHVFVAAVYLAIGPCLAIPRTSSTSFEMFEPLLPAGVSLETARLVFSIAFFAVALLLAMRPNALTKLLGRITGPALIVLLVFVIGSALLDPAPSLPAARDAYAAAPAMSGFLTGYQTMDLLASLTFGIVIAANIRELGVTDDGGLVREVSRAGVFAGPLMGVIYCGLAVVGKHQHRRRAAERDQRAEILAPPRAPISGRSARRWSRPSSCSPASTCASASSAAAGRISPTSSPACRTAPGPSASPSSPAWSPTSASMPSSRSPCRCSTPCTPWRSSWC